MALHVIRLFFILISVIVGYQAGIVFNAFGENTPLIGAISAGILAILLMITEMAMRRVSVRGLSASVFGLAFGLILANLIANAFVALPLNETFEPLFRVILTLVFCYLGMMIAVHGRDEFNLIIPYIKFSRQDQNDQIILLDTSVIIDGRIADICKTSFVEGRFVIPRFVLKELQQIADSQDSLKRNRGRRGLDILNKIQKNNKLDVKIHEEDFPDISEVDTKLVKLGKMLGAKVFTNDYNLNKIAELQGVSVLNINELAEALRPVVLPGELMEIKVIKEGKEYNQGVAYLDDGTMVVVDNGRYLIGQTVKVVVTSVLQTSAGRMIFTKSSDEKDSRRK